jgi:hypothetical protein
MRSSETAAYWENPPSFRALCILHGLRTALDFERQFALLAVMANSAYCGGINIYSSHALRSRLRASSVENRPASNCHESIVLWRTESRPLNVINLLIV